MRQQAVERHPGDRPNTPPFDSPGPSPARDRALPRDDAGRLAIRRTSGAGQTSAPPRWKLQSVVVSMACARTAYRPTRPRRHQHRSRRTQPPLRPAARSPDGVDPLARRAEVRPTPTTESCAGSSSRVCVPATRSSTSDVDAAESWPTGSAPSPRCIGWASNSTRVWHRLLLESSPALDATSSLVTPSMFCPMTPPSSSCSTRSVRIRSRRCGRGSRHDHLNTPHSASSTRTRSTCRGSRKTRRGP